LRCLRYRSRSVGVVEPHCPGIPIPSQAGARGPLIIVGHLIDAVGETVAGAARIGKGEPAFSSHVVSSQPRTPGPSRGFQRYTKIPRRRLYMQTYRAAISTSPRTLTSRVADLQLDNPLRLRVMPSESLTELLAGLENGESAQCSRGRVYLNGD